MIEKSEKSKRFLKSGNAGSILKLEDSLGANPKQHIVG